MGIQASIQTFHFANTSVEAFIPSLQWVQEVYEHNAGAPTPYWAQIWPAAKALCQMIASEPVLVKDKAVLELAAGLGLPSLLAAQFAKEVTASDYMPEAVALMKQSAHHNKLTNMQCRVIDWNRLDKKLCPDVLLLSDINYSPASFETLYKAISNFIQQGTTVLLSTPQRLMAKPFMERLQPWQRKAYNTEVKHNSKTVFASVWLLSKNEI